MSSMPHRVLSTDTLAYRAKVAVVVPGTNTVVQPEMEAMRPAGVTNHVTRMRLPPRPYNDQEAYKKALETEEGDLEEALKLVLLCEPHVVAHGHSIHSFRGMGNVQLMRKSASKPYAAYRLSHRRAPCLLALQRSEIPNGLPFSHRTGHRRMT